MPHGIAMAADNFTVSERKTEALFVRWFVCMLLCSSGDRTNNNNNNTSVLLLRVLLRCRGFGSSGTAGAAGTSSATISTHQMALRCTAHATWSSTGG